MEWEGKNKGYIAYIKKMSNMILRYAKDNWIEKNSDGDSDSTG